MTGQDNLEVIVCSARLFLLSLCERCKGGSKGKRRPETRIVSADSSMFLHTVDCWSYNSIIHLRNASPGGYVTKIDCLLGIYECVARVCI